MHKLDNCLWCNLAQLWKMCDSVISRLFIYSETTQYSWSVKGHSLSREHAGHNHRIRDSAVGQRSCVAGSRVHFPQCWASYTNPPRCPCTYGTGNFALSFVIRFIIYYNYCYDSRLYFCMHYVFKTICGLFLVGY